MALTANANETELFPQTASLLKRARERDAALRARPGVLANGYAEDDHAYPVFCERAKGAYVWDVDGNRYIDLVLGFGSVVLGHNHRTVTAAVTSALEQGVCPTLACREQIELAERLAEIVPNAEMSFFLKTGSDATSLAVRLARAITGRSTVLRWGYHGWHDWCAPSPHGTVAEHREKTRSFTYNSLTSLNDAFAAAPDDVACVIMMPFEIDMPDAGFLEGVRALCSQKGALLVFDEVRSGFRVALGGAQQAFGVDADLICMSKAIANGHPLSVLSGRADHMRHLDTVSASSTFFRGRDGFAAGLATIGELTKAFEAGQPERISALLCEAFDNAISKSGAPMVRVGHDAAPFLSWPHVSPDLEVRALRRFCAEMLGQGVLLHPTHHWFFSLALDPEDITQLEDAAVRVLAGMVSDGAFED